ncbi:MAG: Glyoxalase/bleomycin resistance protein/dioxygenase [Gemmatimonadetes bacterium]|nr:Glyoxalase/bleomycin resistance protein/dioxygenase [Gemmatimonadota bacterium]
MQQTFPAVQSLAPILIVEAIEPCVAFWRDRLGFTTENEVPGEDGRLMFVSVKSGPVEIMYQTRASVLAEDASKASELQGHSTALFVQLPSIADLDLAERAMEGAPVVKPRHATFYGTTEFYVREPGGNIVGFASR